MADLGCRKKSRQVRPGFDLAGITNTVGTPSLRSLQGAAGPHAIPDEAAPLGKSKIIAPEELRIQRANSPLTLILMAALLAFENSDNVL